MKRVLCFDVETTGVDLQNDKILQIAAVIKDIDTMETLKQVSEYIKPVGTYTIAPTAEKVHGLSFAFIEENGKSLKDVWENELKSMFEDADTLLTYNGNRFDITMLKNNLAEVGVSFQIPTIMQIYDAYVIEQKYNSLSLVNVYKRYFNEEFDDAHDAFADVNATLKVFKKQTELYDMTLTPDIAYTSPEGMVMYNTSENTYEWKNGKHRGELVRTTFSNDPGYIKWLFTKFNNTGCSQQLKDIILSCK